MWTEVFSPDGVRFATASPDKTACIWDARFATMSTKDLVVKSCMRPAGRLASRTRDEMPLAGYPDGVPEINVCAGSE